MSTTPRSKNLINNQPIHPMDFIHTILDLHKNNQLIQFNITKNVYQGVSMCYLEYPLNISNLSDAYQTILHDVHNREFNVKINNIIFQTDNKLYILQYPIRFSISVKNNIRTLILPTFISIGFTPEYIQNQLNQLQTQITNIKTSSKYSATY